MSSQEHDDIPIHLISGSLVASNQDISFFLSRCNREQTLHMLSLPVVFRHYIFLAMNRIEPYNIHFANFICVTNTKFSCHFI